MSTFISGKVFVVSPLNLENVFLHINNIIYIQLSNLVDIAIFKGRETVTDTIVYLYSI